MRRDGRVDSAKAGTSPESPHVLNHDLGGNEMDASTGVYGGRHDQCCTCPLMLFGGNEMAALIVLMPESGQLP